MYDQYQQHRFPQLRLINSLAAHAERASESDWQPATDVAETETAFVLRLDLPGVDPATVKVEQNGDRLTVSGARQSIDEDATLRRAECQTGDFERSFRLPDAADDEAIEAESAYGVLTIRIQKRAPLQPRQIAVRTA